MKARVVGISVLLSAVIVATSFGGQQYTWQAVSGDFSGSWDDPAHWKTTPATGTYPGVWDENESTMGDYAWFDFRGNDQDGLTPEITFPEGTMTNLASIIYRTIKSVVTVLNGTNTVLVMPKPTKGGTWGGNGVDKGISFLVGASTSSRMLFFDGWTGPATLKNFNIRFNNDSSEERKVTFESGDYDFSDAGSTMWFFEQSVSEDEKNVAIREAFRQHGINLFYLCGVPREIGEKRMEKILNMETELAQACYTKEQLRDPEANYHKMGLDELIRVTGGFDWRTFLRDYSYDQTTEVDLSEPEPVAAGCRILMNAPLEDLKDLCELRLIMGASSCLSSAFDDENLDFNSKLTGVKDKHPRWKIAVGTVSGLMEDAIGQMFVEKYFSAEAKEVMLEMIRMPPSLPIERASPLTVTFVIS
mgnify:CR=1 FL=1